MRVSLPKKVILFFIKLSESSRKKSKLNVLNTFPIFNPNSAGSYESKASFVIESVNNIFSALENLLNHFSQTTVQVLTLEDFFQGNIQDQNELEYLFNKYGSDKSTIHNYHKMYASILSNRNEIQNIFEIGLGTNYTDVLSNMGILGNPGASLKAFRDFCPNANIYGADIDRRVLFSEHRIQTFFCDQNIFSTLENLAENLPGNFDLVIDDGLHSPLPNLHSLIFGLSVIKPNGWIVIEDISSESLDFWRVVYKILEHSYSPYIIKTKTTFLFAVQKKTLQQLSSIS